MPLTQIDYDVVAIIKFKLFWIITDVVEPGTKQLDSSKFIKKYVL